MLLFMPFLNLSARLCPQTLGIAALLVIDKLGEFYMAAVCLSVLSAFEVKAWLGLALFLSYASDCLLFGESVSAAKIICLPFACLGLMMIASGGEVGEEKNGAAEKRRALIRILPALAMYIIAKYAYGLIMRMGEPYLTKNTGLFISMIALTAIMAAVIYPRKSQGKTLLNRLYAARERVCDYAEYKKMLLIVFATRLPNIAGLLAENALIGISLTLYSFVQPLILVTLFFISVIKREKFTRKNLAGSLICIAAIFAFELF
jgi:multidrug transporter EmrE-like cation transporter